MAMTKIKGLQQWCRRMTEGYAHVDISNFTTSWRNGMAFCALIHRFRPDLIDYDALLPDNVFENNKLAFEVGESELNIPAFLEADDMARLQVPDKLSVITYVSQYYNNLHQLPQLGGPGVKGQVKKGVTAGTKRPPDSSKVASEPTNKKTVSAKEEHAVNSSTTSPRKGTVGDKCSICQNKVYLLERHIEGGKLYHRSCYRHSELSPTNKVYTKSPYMSPALNQAKATLDSSHGATQTSSDHSDNHIITPKNVHDKRNENLLLSDLKSGLKKVDAVASKHSLHTDKEKEEDAKKAKVQPRALFGSSENNKSKTEPKIEEPVFPLSGKEAKKLEKRRQEILSSESSTPTSHRAKRGMPLIFQKEKSSSDGSSQPSGKLTTSSLPSSSGSTFSSSLTPSVRVSKDKTSTPVLSNENVSTKKVFEMPNSKSHAEDKNTNTDIQSLQKKFSTQPESLETKSSSNTSQPVARPRPRVTGSKVASSPFMDNSANGKTDADKASNVVARNKESVPKAVPRKSLIENKDKQQLGSKTANDSFDVLPSSGESSSADDSFTSPPALPLSPPPSLPSSAVPSSLSKTSPPPLPTSPHPTTSTPIPSHPSGFDASPSKLRSKSPFSSPAKDQNAEKPYNHNHPPSFSSKSSSSSLSSTDKSVKLKPRSHTDPQNSVATLVIPTEKKDDGQVLSGLLASLAGVRGRSASIPGISPTTPVTSATSFTTLNSTSQAGSPFTGSSLSNRKLSEPAVKVSSSNGLDMYSVAGKDLGKKLYSPGTPSKILSTQAPVGSPKSSKMSTPEALSVLNSLKPVTQPNQSDEPQHKTQVPDRSSDQDKQIKLRSAEKQKPQQSKANTKGTASELVKNYLSKSKEDLTLDKSTTYKTSSKSEDAFKKPFTPSQAKNINQSKVEMPPSANQKMSPRVINGSKENLTHFNDVKLKPVSPHSRPQDVNVQTTNTVTSSSFGVKLNKVGTRVKKVDEDRGPLSQSAAPKNDARGKETKTNLNSNSNTPKSEMEIPQWRKDIEERKRKLREDIIRSETPSKWNDKRDKDKPETVKATSTTGNKPREASLSSSSDESPRSKDLSNRASPGNLSDEQPQGEKLSWQKEAERRMAAFAMFDSSEDESKSHDLDWKAEERLHGSQTGKTKSHLESGDAGQKKMAVMNGSNFKSKLKDFEVSRQKMALKPVDIDISSPGPRSRWKQGETAAPSSQPLSLNHNNNKVPEKRDGDVILSRDKQKDEQVNDSRQGPVGQEADQGRQPSPKVKRKITVLGKKDQDEGSTAPSSPVKPPKKKITVTAKFDFDSTAPSDFESSLTSSTEQMTINDNESSAVPLRPPRPKSQRNKVASPKQISAIELQQQLLEIDNRLTDLELRGRDLEDSIRNASFLEGSADDDEDDRLMMEWFQLVSEKNDLVRQEADLVYLSREQDLEDEQEQIDAQLRYLMNKDELTKSPQEREEEAYLLQHKLDIVNQRSSIIDSMDEDRIRYEEEDRSIEEILKSKGYWKDDGTLLAEKGKKVAKSMFYA